jgi:hypothetical protein
VIRGYFRIVTAKVGTKIYSFFLDVSKKFVNLGLTGSSYHPFIRRLVSGRDNKRNGGNQVFGDITCLLA